MKQALVKSMELIKITKKAYYEEFSIVHFVANHFYRSGRFQYYHTHTTGLQLKKLVPVTLWWGSLQVVMH